MLCSRLLNWHSVPAQTTGSRSCNRSQTLLPSRVQSPDSRSIRTILPYNSAFCLVIIQRLDCLPFCSCHLAGRSSRLIWKNNMFRTKPPDQHSTVKHATCSIKLAGASTRELFHRLAAGNLTTPLRHIYLPEFSHQTVGQRGPYCLITRPSVLSSFSGWIERQSASIISAGSSTHGLLLLLVLWQTTCCAQDFLTGIPWRHKPRAHSLATALRHLYLPEFSHQTVGE